MINSRRSMANNQVATLKMGHRVSIRYRLQRSLGPTLTFLLAFGAPVTVARSAEGASVQANGRVAITIDDLPYVGGSSEVEAAARVTMEMLAALEAHRSPAVAFVTSSRVLVRDQADERMDVLRRWRDAGVELANHGHSHLSFQTTPPRRYRDDAIQGDLIPRLLLDEIGREPRYYRHPFNHTGPSRAEKRAFEDFMADRGYRIAPFTVEHGDYLFNALYVAARVDGDSSRMERIGAAYLAQLDMAFAFAEELSREAFGREIAQVFLIHANDINADYLARMLERLQERGYGFVTLEEAESDPAYATADKYVGPTGISWLHRWRVALRLPERWREEPDPPLWVLEAYRNR